MNLRLKCIAVFLLLTIIVCSSESEDNRLDSQFMDGIRIAWDFSSARQLATQGGYPRMIRLTDSSLVAVYQNYEGGADLIRSYRWFTPITTLPQFVYTNKEEESTLINISNPEIYQLANRDIILAYNYRPDKAEIAPYAIVIKRSADNGIICL